MRPFQTPRPQSETAVVLLRTRENCASSPHLLSEGGTRGGIEEDLPVLTPAPAPVLHHRHPLALRLAHQKDKSGVTDAQRAAPVHRPPLAPSPAPHPGTTGGLTLDQGAAGQDPGPGPSQGPHPDPDHHPRGFAADSGETFTEAESPGGSGESMR